MADFATAADLATHLGVPAYTGASLTRASAMLAKASALIRLTTGQDLEQAGGRVEEYAGADGQSAIFLTQRPVTAVSVVTIAAVAFTAYTWKRWGTLERTDGSDWDAGPIVVTYDSGYAVGSDGLEAIMGITCEVAGRALTSSPAESNTFGPEVPEAVGWVPHLFLTPQEINQLASLGPSEVG